MFMERERFQDCVGNGEKLKPTFSAKEMQRRQGAVRNVMAELKIDAALFTSYNNICYLSDFLLCFFGRRDRLEGTPAISTGHPYGPQHMIIK